MPVSPSLSGHFLDSEPEAIKAQAVIARTELLGAVEAQGTLPDAMSLKEMLTLWGQDGFERGRNIHLAVYVFQIWLLYPQRFFCFPGLSCAYRMKRWEEFRNCLGLNSACCFLKEVEGQIRIVTKGLGSSCHLPFLFVFPS